MWIRSLLFILWIIYLLNFVFKLIKTWIFTLFLLNEIFFFLKIMNYLIRMLTCVNFPSIYSIIDVWRLGPSWLPCFDIKIHNIVYFLGTCTILLFIFSSKKIATYWSLNLGKCLFICVGNLITDTDILNVRFRFSFFVTLLLSCIFALFLLLKHIEIAAKIFNWSCTLWFERLQIGPGF